MGIPTAQAHPPFPCGHPYEKANRFPYGQAATILIPKTDYIFGLANIIMELSPQ